MLFGHIFYSEKETHLFHSIIRSNKLKINNIFTILAPYSPPAHAAYASPAPGLLLLIKKFDSFSKFAKYLCANANLETKCRKNVDLLFVKWHLNTVANIFLLLLFQLHIAHQPLMLLPLHTHNQVCLTIFFCWIVHFKWKKYRLYAFLMDVFEQ